ncbi:polysaccharide deacetylase family protein [Streptomyces sp. NPDC007100]|uniref:polysaccharide deacetylase family protein n=1 Tax=Streptomyces sp. NPDC007100 TaxID=3155602 RepID=UPI0033D3A4B2
MLTSAGSRPLTTVLRVLAPLALLLPPATACGSAPAVRGAPSAPAPVPVPTLPAGPDGRTAVFAHGPRYGGGATGRAGDAARPVALTFDADMTSDDGARAAGGVRFDNPALIASLRRMRVPATVFVTGRWAEQYPDQTRSIGRDPLFEVANHSYAHHSFTPSASCYGLPALAPEAMRGDVDRAFAAFRRAGVTRPVPYFRFPGGCYDDHALRAVAPAGVTVVQWDVIGGDAFARNPDRVAEQVLAGVRPGSVVVLHCTRSAAPATEEAVRTIVPTLRKRGYRFVRVSELIAAARGAKSRSGPERVSPAPERVPPGPERSR